MNWDQVEGKWKQMKGVVRQKWGKLTDDDIDLIGGKQQELVGRLQERYGYSKEEAERNVDEWSRTINTDDTSDLPEERRRAS
ncbi:MAG TPA: CsbD family protein [Terriglobales bacterium]|nr:CsbD family protein [Terriglobales bacterium]